VALAEEVRESGPKAQPLIAAWREALMAAGISVKRRPPSIEAMARRAWKGHDAFSINPIVDTYNALSMELCLPLGAWDLDEMNGGLQLRISEGGEPFQALGAGDVEETEPVEIVYSDVSEVLSRHFLWRQSDKAKITEHTKRFVFVSELVEAMGEDVLSRARERIEHQFTHLLNGDVRIEVVR
jgi:DNA/RNA-binding domain of Phe-tRNA-synthetase-like protein